MLDRQSHTDFFSGTGYYINTIKYSKGAIKNIPHKYQLNSLQNKPKFNYAELSLA